MREFKRRRQRRPTRYRQHSGFFPAFFLAVAVFALVAVWTWAVYTAKTDMLGTLAGATIAAASIVYSLSRARLTGRNQYTLTLIASRFTNQDYLENVRVIGALRREKLLDETTRLVALKDYGAIEQDGRRPYDACVRFLNFWEHVCTAYVDDHLDRQLFEDLVGDLVFDVVRYFATVIGDMRAEDPEIMEYICTTWFALANDADRRRFSRLLGTVPYRLCSDDCSEWARHCGTR